MVERRVRLSTSSKTGPEPVCRPRRSPFDYQAKGDNVKLNIMIGAVAALTGIAYGRSQAAIA